MTKQFFQNPNKNQAKYFLKLNRLDASRYVKIITGHNGLFYFKNKIDPEINAICRFCLEEDETFYHILTSCPRHRGNRERIFLDTLPDFNENWAVRDLISFSKLSGVREALEGDTSLGWFDWSGNESEDDGVSAEIGPTSKKKRWK